MGNSICHCKTICLTKKEEDLSTSNLSTTFNYNIKRSRNKLINTSSTFTSNENLNSIYRKNCAEKIIKAYFEFKKNKIKKDNNEYKNIELTLNEDEDENTENNKNNLKKEIEAYDNLDQLSINHPFYIDKIHKSKTLYEKFNIPKINNGKSLETLNRNSSGHHIIFNENKVSRKNKK